MRLKLIELKLIAIEAAKEAGKILLELSKNKINYKMKSKHDILAEADLESEKKIIAKIKENFPEHSILSEENGEEINKSDYLWIIDPLDGTINFSRGIEEFCISIAIEYKRELILGLIYQPINNKMFIAEKGKGANLNGKKIKVSDEADNINMILATDNSGKIETRINNYNILFKICDKFRHIRIFGSAALHLAKIASGNIDVYYKTKFNYWDYAAGILIIQEAGGKVTDFKGNTINRSSKDIVASNGKIHNKLLKLLLQIK